MKMLNFKNMIGMMLMAVLIPCALYAQDNTPNYSAQTFNDEELAQMLAPVALYPDPLLSQILMAATYPFEVVEAQRWMSKRSYLKGEALDKALQAKSWDVSVLALCHYPGVLTMMTDNLDWTARLGDAFASQEDDVVEMIQQLRARAYDAGNLSSTPEQNVIIEESYIRIEPVNSEYIYVPAYDPFVIYGAWWFPMYPPLTIILPGLVASGPGIIFSSRFHAGVGVFGWSYFNWGVGNVVIVDIERTRRFNRHVRNQKRPDRYHWRPDFDRRSVREKRAGEIPRFVPPVRSKPDMRHWDRKPVPDVRTPDRSRTIPDQPRSIERDRLPQWNPPEPEKGKRSDADGPRAVDKDRPGIQDRRIFEKDKPAPKPRVPDKEKMKVPEQGMNKPPVPQDRRMIEKDNPAVKPRVPDKENMKVQEQGMNKPPVFQDRGKGEGGESRKQPSVIDPKTGAGDQKVREGDGRKTIHMEPRGDKDDRFNRSKERSDDRQEQQERGGMPRERGDKKQ